MRAILSSFCIIICLAGAGYANPIEPYSGFVGFGDSFSDKGRFGQLQPPSNGGRFTDGITWMEVLGNAFEERGQGNFNMAMGGATAGDVNDNDPDYLVAETLITRDANDPDDIPFFDLGTFSRQVGSFVDASFDTLVGANPLVMIQLGGNDFLQGATDASDVIGAIVNGILEVASAGAQFDSFLVANLPDFSIQPEFFNADLAFKADIRAQSIAYNAALEATLASLATATGLEIEIFDFFVETDSIYAEADAAGFLILDDVCTSSLSSPLIDLGNRCFAPGSSSDFLFVDDVHLGDFAHSRWGAAALAQVSDRLAPVPLPAGAPLLLLGIGALVVVRRR